MFFVTGGVKKKETPALVAGAIMYHPGRNATFFMCAKEHNLVLTVQTCTFFPTKPIQMLFIPS